MPNSKQIYSSSPLTDEEILKRFSNLNTWKRGNERAPHKPLLLLLALGECKNKQNRLMLFSDIEPQIKELLVSFGPPRRSFNAEHPFWRLVNDGLWDIPKRDKIQVNSSGDPKRSDLIGQSVEGGFAETIFRKLQANPQLIDTIAENILHKNFPETYYDDILLATGLYNPSEQEGKQISRRDPSFRNRIMTIYQNKCAICGFDLRMGSSPVCIEAAHIKWHQAGGPSTEQNGIALCSLHHKMFDRGIIAIDNSRKILISEYANGPSAKKWAYDFAGQTITVPVDPDYYPCKGFTDWHFKEVFKEYKP